MLDDDVYYAITGNFNDWSDDRLAEGEVPGVHCGTFEMPASGKLEFRILKDGDTNQVICPAEAECSKKTVPILGPGPKLTNKWVVKGEAGSDVQIEFLQKRGVTSIMWLMLK